MDNTSLLITANGVLVAALWYSIRTWMAKVDAKLDRIGQLEKDCVTWADHEALKLNVSGIDRRVTVIETVCEQQHGK